MDYETIIFVTYFLVVIPIFLVVSSWRWFFVVKKLNAKLNQSFPSLAYSVLWLVPFINVFIIWIILGDAWEREALNKEKTLSKYRFSILLPYILVCGAYGIIFIPLTIISIILMVFLPFVGEALLQATPFIAVIISVVFFVKLLKNLSVFEDSIN